MSIKKQTEGQFFMKVMWSVWQNPDHPLCKAVREAYQKGVAPEKVVLLPASKPRITATKKTNRKPTAKKPVKTYLARTFTLQGVKNVPVKIVREIEIDEYKLYVNERLPLPGHLQIGKDIRKKYEFRLHSTGELIHGASSIKKGINEIQHLINRAKGKSERKETVYTNPKQKEEIYGTIEYHETFTDWGIRPVINS